MEPDRVPGYSIPRASKVGFILSATILLYSALSSNVRENSGTQQSYSLRVLPFDAVLSKGIYDKYDDDRLKFITATVSNKMKDLCDDAGKDISWDRLQVIMLQNAALQEKNKRYDKRNFYFLDGKAKVSNDEMKKRINTYVKECDTDVFDAVRIHDPEITEVIQFVANQSVEFGILPKSVSNSMSLLDIGMIRFPTKDNPYVKLYRFQLTGTFSGSRFMMVQDTEERILTVTVDSCEYYPNYDLLQRIDPEYVDKTIARFEDTLTA